MGRWDVWAGEGWRERGAARRWRADRGSIRSMLVSTMVCVSWEKSRHVRGSAKRRGVGRVGGASHHVDVRSRALARKLGQVCMHAPDAVLEWVPNRNGLRRKREDTKLAERLSKTPTGSHVRVSVADFSQAQ